jgi:putative SOS response-associated peptidase YedK
MCYHVKTPDGKFLKESVFAKDYELIAEFDRYYHAIAFDHPVVPVITNLEPRMIQPAEWGLVTSKRVYEDTARKMQKFTVNAVGEELFEKKSYKELAPTNRCIIIVEGFYEWMHVGQGKNAVKYPFFIQPSHDQFFLVGGIWNDWTNVNTGEEKLSAVVITSPANPLMAKIHNSKERMPFILDKSEIHRWLDPGLKKEDILHFIKPYDENKMKAHTISRKFNQFQKGETNVADICERVDYPELQLLQ